MEKKSLRYQLLSFRWAINGLSEFFRTEFKARIHSIATVLAVFTGFILKVSLTEWCLICTAIALVFITEIFNTAMETIAGTLPDKFDNKRRIIKDMCAGAVLISSIGAFFIGILIFTPKIIELWQEKP
jgi:diacylglycerol kinase